MRVGLVAQSRPTAWDPMDCSPARLYCLWGFPSKNVAVGCHFLLKSLCLWEDATLGHGFSIHWTWRWRWETHVVSPSERAQEKLTAGLLDNAKRLHFLDEIFVCLQAALSSLSVFDTQGLARCLVQDLQTMHVLKCNKHRIRTGKMTM